MNPRSVVALFLMLLLLGCRVQKPALQPTPRSALKGTEAPITIPAATPSPSNTPCCQVRLHPEKPFYVGDQISFEVIAPSEERFLNQSMTVTLTSAPNPIGTATFQPFGFDRRTQATMLWAWDTSLLQAGQYTLQFSIPTLKEEWTETVALLPRSAMPVAERSARWQALDTPCCTLHFITNTAAHRDLEEIVEIVEREYQAVLQKIPLEQKEERPQVVLIPRVIGNGGFANGEINVSYLDRNYTAADFATILHHEMVHVVDQQVNQDERPSLFVEGIAVYLSGGHYIPEPLLTRAAVLYNLNRHFPLRDLAEDFYSHQHESAYLEAGALVEYMSQRWGWQTVWKTYLSMSLKSGETHLQAIERSLNENLGISLQRLEQDYFAYLGSIEENVLTFQDVANLTLHYETLRNYQQLLDPAAYFRTAWMLDARQMRSKGIVADYWRHPRQPENITIELLLNEAGRARRAGEIVQGAAFLDAIKCALEGLKEKHPEPFSCHGSAKSGWEIVQILLAAGYEPQMWVRDLGYAEVIVTQGSTQLKQVILELRGEEWQIVSGTNAAADELIEGTQ